MSELEGRFFLCKVSDLVEGEPRKFVVHGSDVLLLKLDGKIHAVEPMCSHDGTDISRGKFSQHSGTLECPKHYAVFDVRSGTPLRGPFGADGDTQPPLRVYRFKIDSGRIMLEANQEWGVIPQYT
ncbi:MAG: Rieske (2Fe-2S) protein [Thaumarchaeota archaeon]|nr:Rieske (2Fe-2S) protein [Nitrososphaerota archaeon]